CEYFGKLLARSSPGSGSGGAGTNEIFLRNTSAQAFQIILNHIYLDSLEVPAELTIPVGALAESYSLLRLRNSCARHCQQSTMLDNAVPRSAPSSPLLCLLCACAMMHATPWID
ncbi:MAG: BTB/POZ domain-containing protein, partial [Promethearchaeia archaeon]